jgi:Major intrinsic protein
MGTPTPTEPIAAKPGSQPGSLIAHYERALSGASMNPARTFGPDLVGRDFSHYLVYVAGSIAGAVVAVAIAFVLRGRGGGAAGSAAAQGGLFTDTQEPPASNP